jgi:amino-acid N-acetyltransferase
MQIERAQPTDAAAIHVLLRRSGLPEDGIDAHLATALVARDGAALVGCAALEVYGTHALLRSVAVDTPARGQGLGHQLTQAALDLARRQGVHDVYLLTETASAFFPRFDFHPIARAAVPAPVQQSVEFTHACPASALVLHTILT